MTNDEIEKEQDRPGEGDDERIDLRREILGGFAIYGLLAVCALFSLVPALLSGGFPERAGAKREIMVAAFFSLDDPSARRQIEHLKRLKERLPEDAVHIHALCVPRPDPEALAAFARAMDAPFPIRMCGENYAREEREREKKQVPFVIVVDVESKRLHKISGFASSDEIELRVRRMLK